MKTALLLLACAGALATRVLAAPPAVDGNLADFITFGQQLQASQTGFFASLVDRPDVLGNPTPETIYNDAKFIPCAQPQPLIGTHWANGTEIMRHYVAYEIGSNTLYIGLITDGAIGDVDGDEDPDQAGSGALCNPQDNIDDSPGISGNQFYDFRFDLNCDGSPDAILRVVDNALVGTGLFLGATGTFAYRKNAALGADGHQLEIALTLPGGPLPASFAYSGVLTNAFDGLTEDRADGIPFVPESHLALSASGNAFCPGEKGRVSSTFSNTGGSNLSVVFTHDLPAGFGYAGGLATNCGTGEPQVDGQKLTFGPVMIGAGSACTLAYDVSSSADCPGPSAVQLEATGTFSSSCLDLGTSLSATATATLTCDPALCAPAGTCRLTGGGCLNEEGDRRGGKQNTFGGNSSPLHDGGGPSGNSWEHILRDGREILFNWHSWDAHVIGCSVVGVGPCHPEAVNTRADFVGTGRYSIGAAGRSEDGNMVAYIVDHKEGSCNKGTRDEYFITVRKGLDIGQGEIVFDRGGFIDCGNLQIHETPARLFPNDIELPGASPGVALLGRPYPNPFSGTTAFAYRVADGGAAVDVGVYNVAGRLVKSLASGTRPAGVHTVTWDGEGDFGVRMAPGVYFLKSKVGDEQTVTRLIYVSH